MIRTNDRDSEKYGGNMWHAITVRLVARKQEKAMRRKERLPPSFNIMKVLTLNQFVFCLITLVIFPTNSLAILAPAPEIEPLSPDPEPESELQFKYDLPQGAIIFDPTVISLPNFGEGASSSNAGSILYSVNDRGSVFSRVGITSIVPGGIKWIQRFLAPKTISVAAVGPIGVVWGLTNISVPGGLQPRVQSSLTSVWWPTSTFGLINISGGGPQGSIWGVNNLNIPFYRVGTSASSVGLFWTPVYSSKSIKSVSVGGPYGDVWALGTLGNSFGNRIYYRIGVTNENPGGVAWIRIGGHLAQISVGGGFSTGGTGPLLLDEAVPEIWGVTLQGNVFKRIGITPENRVGTTWILIPSPGITFQKVAVMGNGKVWALSDIPSLGGFVVFYFTGLVWIPISGGATDISAF